METFSLAILDTGGQGFARHSPWPVLRNENNIATFSPTVEPASYARVSVLGRGSSARQFANVTKHVNVMGMALCAKAASDDDKKPVDRFGCVLVLYTGKKDDVPFLHFFQTNKQWISVFFLKVYVCEGSPESPQTLNTAVRLALNHGYEWIHLAAVQDASFEIKKEDDLVVQQRIVRGAYLHGVFDFAGTMLVVVQRCTFTGAVDVATWGFVWDAAGYMEQKFTSTGMATFFTRHLHREHGVVLVMERRGFATILDVPLWENELSKAMECQAVNNKGLIVGVEAGLSCSFAYFKYISVIGLLESIIFSSLLAPSLRPKWFRPFASSGISSI